MILTFDTLNTKPHLDAYFNEMIKSIIFAKMFTEAYLKKGEGTWYKANQPALISKKWIQELDDGQEDSIWEPLPCGFPGGSVVKNLPAKAGDMCSIPGSERSL